MTDVYTMILNEFKNRNLADYSKFPPYFISSIGCHWFNIINQQNHILTEGGLDLNTRLHIIMVAPQGQSKSFWLKQFLEGHTSILNGTAIKTDFELRMSEAGYLGTKKFGHNDQILETEGLCEAEKQSIVGIEEFSDLMKSVSAQDYNIGLENELLTTLDSGYALKRLAAGKIEYKTHLTLWTATQPGRYNLTSGLGRRFLFIFNIPTEQSMTVLKERRRASIDVVVDQANLFEIKKALNLKFDEMVTKINKVSFEKNFYDFMDKLHVIHYEEPLYERLALGYNLMKHPIESTINVSVDNTLKRLIKTEWAWRKKIKSGTEESMVWTFIESAAGLTLDRCLEVLLDFGMELKAAQKSIRELQKRGLIEIEEGKIKIKEKHFSSAEILEPEQEQSTLVVE